MTSNHHLRNPTQQPQRPFFVAAGAVLRHRMAKDFLILTPMRYAHRIPASPLGAETRDRANRAEPKIIYSTFTSAYPPTGKNLPMSHPNRPATRVSVSLLRFAGLLLAALTAIPLFAQQGFVDPFQKNGFHEGDLYSSLGNSHLDATTGRLIYAIPFAKLPRNGKLPQSLALVYNSNGGDLVSTSLQTITTSGQPVYQSVFVPNLGSNVGQGWRLSMGSLLLENGGRGLKFVDPSGAEHHLFHTEGCPADACPSDWKTNGSLNAWVNEMQPGIYRSADGEFMRAVVTNSGSVVDVTTVTRVEVTTAAGVIYVFDEFHPVPNRNTLVVAFDQFSPRVGEVKLIKDADGNQINLGYDHGTNGSEWYLRTINDGIRTVSLTWDYTEFSNLTIDDLKTQGLILDCLENGQPDTRSCKGAHPPAICKPNTNSLLGDPIDPIDPHQIRSPASAWQYYTVRLPNPH